MSDLEPLYLDVDKNRLLELFPTFFASASDMLAELVQNAYRAGATWLDLSVDLDSRELIAIDNGKGVADPRNLIHAGKTGWGNGVVDPAGLGFFSLLGISRQVTVYTKARSTPAWWVTIDKACFQGKEVVREEISWEGIPSETGMKIHARLDETADLVFLNPDHYDFKSNCQKFRHVFPLQVTLTVRHQDKETRNRIDPPTLQDPLLICSAGEIGFYEDQAYLRCLTPIWEHRLISHTDIHTDLGTLMAETPEGKIAYSLLKGAFYWRIDPKAGIRPKLPDRRELIKDEGYWHTLRQVRDAVLVLFNAEGLRAAAHRIGLPETIGDNNRKHVSRVTDTVRLSPLFSRHGSVHGDAPLLRLFGYQRLSWEGYDQDSYHEESDDGIHRESPDDHVWALTPLRVRHSELAAALNREQKYAACHKAPSMKLRLTNVQVADFHGISIGRADQIQVVQEGVVVADLARLLVYENASDLLEDNNQLEEPGTLILTTESELKLLDLVKEDEEMFGCVTARLHEDNNLRDYWEGQGDDSGLHTERLVAALRHELIRVFFPETQREHARYTSLVELRETRQDLARKLNALADQAQQARDLYPEVENLDGLITATEQLIQIRLPCEQYRPTILDRAYLA